MKGAVRATVYRVGAEGLERRTTLHLQKTSDIRLLASIASVGHLDTWASRRSRLHPDAVKNCRFESAVL